jgi:glycosyltransferase involved in cell wall biosynthesis
MVSALVASKRVEAGIDVISKLPDAHLVVAGDGPLKDFLEAKAEHLLPDRYKQLSIPPERMPDLYRSADVFLHLAKEEPFGNVFVEAMACGLPVVGHDTPRLRWIVGDDGFLLDTDDLAAVVREIERARRAVTGGQAKRITRAATFSWTKVGELYRVFLREVIDSFRFNHRKKLTVS